MIDLKSVKKKKITEKSNEVFTFLLYYIKFKCLPIQFNCYTGFLIYCKKLLIIFCRAIKYVKLHNFLLSN